VFLQGVRVLENGGGKEDCLFAKNWVVIANDYLGEDFMCRAASATPPISNNFEFRIFLKKGKPTRLRKA
jgi:hypothetical protein